MSFTEISHSTKVVRVKIECLSLLTTYHPKLIFSEGTIESFVCVFPDPCQCPSKCTFLNIINVTIIYCGFFNLFLFHLMYHRQLSLVHTSLPYSFKPFQSNPYLGFTDFW